MSKRKIQILVISLLAVLIVGGAFLNNKYTKVATPAANSSSEVSAAKKEDVSKKEQKKDNANKEKSAKDSHKSSKDKQKKDAEKIKKEKINDKKIAANSNKTTSKAEGEKQEKIPSTTPNKEPSKQQEVPHNKEPSKQPEAQPNKDTVKPSQPSQPSKPSKPSQSTPEHKPNPEPEPEPEPEKEITLSIRGTAANSSAYFISPQKVTIKEGESVMDVLGRFCRDNGIQVGIRNGNYVAGINNLYEFDKGSESGWLYRVNGVFPSYGAASYALKVGDTIEWMYTEDLGHDVGAPQG